MTIYISIISYKDDELVKTIKSLLHNATKPQELHFGVVSQHFNKKHPDLSFVKNLKYHKMLFTHARGAGYARKIAMEMYDGQDYFLQLDSHMRFAKHWDTKLIAMHKEAQQIAGTEKVILSQFPAPYEVHTGGKDYFPKGDVNYWDEPSWTTVVNTWSGVWAGSRMAMEDKSKPHKSHTILAALLFAPGYITQEVPYDERICFMGEELCFAIRAYTRNWEIYAPNEMIAWHFYQRKNDVKVWNQMEDSTRLVKWVDLESLSQKTQRDILLGIEKGIYGIDDHDRYIEYQEMIGIDFHKFYNQQAQAKINDSLLVQEITFNEDAKKSNYCRNDRHKGCNVKDCMCDCHKEKK
jgi:hypothetical protein